jgi:uncharacterized membrane protein
MHDQHSVEHIIARAQEELAARQQATLERRWQGWWRWLPSALVLGILALFIVAPGALPDKLLWSMGGVCGLRPSHSYFAGNVQLPIESRMVGIYGGFTLTLATLLAMGRMGARRLGGTLTIAILVIMFASMAFDGVNSTFTDLGLAHPYMSTNLTRLLTGLLSGIATAAFLLWLLGVVTMPPSGTPRPVIRSPWELLVPLLLNAGFAVLVVSGQPLAYYPIALASVGGVVGVLMIVALLVVVAISGLDGRVTRLRLLAWPGALALLIAFAVVGGTAALRWTLLAGVQVR